MGYCKNVSIPKILSVNYSILLIINYFLQKYIYIYIVICIVKSTSQGISVYNGIVYDSSCSIILHNYVPNTLFLVSHQFNAMEHYFKALNNKENLFIPYKVN